VFSQAAYFASSFMRDERFGPYAFRAVLRISVHARRALRAVYQQVFDERFGPYAFRAVFRISVHTRRTLRAIYQQVFEEVLFVNVISELLPIFVVKCQQAPTPPPE